MAVAGAAFEKLAGRLEASAFPAALQPALAVPLPGLALLVTGFAVTTALYFSPLRIGGAGLDIHTMLYAAAGNSARAAALPFRLVRARFAQSAGLLPRKPLVERLLRTVTLERGLLAGIGIAAIGFLWSAAAFWQWHGTGFGALDPRTMMRETIPASALMVGGMEVALASFLLSVLRSTRAASDPMARRPAPLGLLLIALVSVCASVARTLMGGQDPEFRSADLPLLPRLQRLRRSLRSGLSCRKLPGLPVALALCAAVLAGQRGDASLHQCLDSRGDPLAQSDPAVSPRPVSRWDERDAPRPRDGGRRFWLLGAVAPTYWHLVGTSYADLLTSVPVLAGLWLTARAMASSATRVHGRRSRVIAVGAALVGPAVGLRSITRSMPRACCARSPWRDSPRHATGCARSACSALPPSPLAAVLRAMGAARLPRVRQSAFPLLQRRVPLSRFSAANLPLTSFVPDNLST
jgi:hypothetical protein